MNDPLNRMNDLGLFVERARASGATPLVVATRRDAEAAVERLIAERGWQRVACSAAASWPGLEPARVGDARDADFGLTVAGWGVAETGSVLVRSGPDVNRGDSLLPLVTGFIVPGDRILPTMGDALRLLDREYSDAQQDGPQRSDIGQDEPGLSGPPPAAGPSCFTFITGPSGTGDLVGQHVLGAHGPAEVFIWVVDDQAGREEPAGRPDRPARLAHPADEGATP